MASTSSIGSPASSRSTASGPRGSVPPQGFLTAATAMLALVLIEGAAETFWRGSPLRWWILAVVGCWVAAMVPAVLFLKWGGRLWLTVVAAVGVVVLAAWRLPPAANPALTILTLPLPNLLALLVVLALLLCAAIVVRLRVVQRLPLLMALVSLLVIYGLLPFAFATAYGTPLSEAARGAGYWTAPPLWLQGGFLALQVIIPFGLVLAALSWLGAVAGHRRPGSAVLPAVAFAVLAGAFAVGSLDLARAGMPNLLSRYAPEWLPSWVQSPAVLPAAPSAAAAPSSGGQTPAASDVRADRLLEPLSRGATTRGVALTVDDVEFATEVGGRAAPPGQMFVIVRTTWQNLMALGTAGREGSAPAPYVVPSLHGQLWLLTDGRYADPIDEGATETLERHLPIGTLAIPAQGEAVTGQVAFRTAANASYLVLVLLDAVSGDAAVSVKGRPIDAPPVPLLGPAASNDALTLAITEARWSEDAPAAPPGLRYVTLGLRAVGRSPGSLATFDLVGSLRLQAESGQETEPQPAAWLKRPFGRPAAVLPGFPNEGQVAFLLPTEAKSARLILRPPAGGTVELPVPFAFGPAQPER